MLPLLTWPYITRVLGPENLGKVNYADFASQVFIVVSAFGIPLYAIRETAIVRNNKEKRLQLAMELTLIYSILALICSITFLAIMHNKVEQNCNLYLFAAANIIIISLSFDWYIQGMEYFKFAAIRSLLIKTGILIAIYLFVKNTNDYTLFFGIFSTGLFLNGVLNAVKIFGENKLRVGKLDIKRHFTPLFHFFLTSSAIGMYEYFDTIILERITQNNEQVGLYTTVLKISRIVTLITITAGSVMLPRISYLISTGNTENAKRYLEKFLGFVIFAGIPASTGIFIFAPEIIQTIAGDKFIPAIPLMQLLGFLPLIIGIGNVFNYQILVSFRQEKKFLLTAVIGCVVSIALNFILIPFLLAKGAAIATLTTEIIVTIVSGIMALKLIKLHISVSSIIQTCFISVVFFPVAIVCRNIFHSPIMIATAGILLCIILYSIVQHLIFKSSTTKEIMSYTKNIFYRGDN